MGVNLADLKAKQAVILAAAKSAVPFSSPADRDPLHASDVAPGAQEVVAAALGGDAAGTGTLSDVAWALQRAVDALEKADNRVGVGGLGRRALRAVGLGGRGDGTLDAAELANAKTGQARVDAVTAQLLRFKGVQDIAIAPPGSLPAFVGSVAFRGVDSFDENVASVKLDVKKDGTATAVVSTGGMIAGPRTLQGKVEHNELVLSGGHGYGESIELKVSLGQRKVASLSVREIEGEQTYHFNLRP